MIQGIEMECVVITLLAFLNPPIDWLAAVIPNSRDLGILAKIGSVVHGKECSYSSVVDHSFNMLCLVRS
jgi:hypothetical protein